MDHLKFMVVVILFSLPKGASLWGSVCAKDFFPTGPTELKIAERLVSGDERVSWLDQNRNRIFLFDRSSRQLQHFDLNTGRPIRSYAVSADGTRLVTTHDGGFDAAGRKAVPSIILWSLDSNNNSEGLNLPREVSRVRLEEYAANISAASFAEDTRILLLGDERSSIYKIDLSSSLQDMVPVFIVNKFLVDPGEVNGAIQLFYPSSSVIDTGRYLALTDKGNILEFQPGN